MRFTSMGVLALVLASCGAKYKPADPVLTPYERALRFPANRPHPQLRYSGSQPATTAPMVPVMAFGAAFDLDFALIPSDDDQFDMIEFARIGLPSGNTWLALETDPSGNQTLIANLDDIDAFMPEIAIARLSNNLQFTDRCTENTVDIDIEYTNSRGQKVTGQLAGDPPGRLSRRRNGKTFDHSENQLMAALDVAASESLFKADVQIDGKGLKLKKIAAIVPARFAMVQTQGGLSTAAFTIVPSSPAVGGPTLADVTVNAPGEEPDAKPPADVLVKMGMAQNAASLTSCWRDRVAEQADLQGGDLTFAFRVDRGSVSNAELGKGEQAFEDQDLVSCVTGALGLWRFDESVSADVTWPFSFRPGSEEDMTDPAVALGQGEIRVDEGAAAPEPAPAPAPTGTGAVPKPEPAGGGGAVPKKDVVPEEADAEGGPGDPIDPGNPGTDLPAEPGSEDDLEGLGEESLDDDAGMTAVPAAVESALSNFTTVHNIPGDRSVELQWLVSRQGDRVVARQVTDLRTLSYNYRLVQGNYLELMTITVEQYGRATPVTAVTFNPPLPDLRWPFGGRWSSDFVIDVNGQQNFAHGTAEAFWTESGPKVQFTGNAPKWVAERPMLTQVTYAKDGTVQVQTSRTGE
jgi:hypothetical protein